MSAPSAPDIADEDSWDMSGGAGMLSAGPSGLDDAFSSFKSRVSSKALGSIAEDALSAQPSGVPPARPVALAVGSWVGMHAGSKDGLQGQLPLSETQLGCSPCAGGLQAPCAVV